MSNKACYQDAFNLLCGKLIGEGAHRIVYACKLRPDLVVKVENGTLRFFANVLEDRFYADNRYYKKVADWLAPVEYMSPDGRLLLMKRADPIPDNYSMPARIPAWLTDLKRENFGLIEGRLVCIDYALTIGGPNIRLKKADW